MVKHISAPEYKKPEARILQIKPKTLISASDVPSAQIPDLTWDDENGDAF